MLIPDWELAQYCLNFMELNQNSRARLARLKCKVFIFYQRYGKGRIIVDASKEALYLKCGWTVKFFMARGWFTSIYFFSASGISCWKTSSTSYCPVSWHHDYFMNRNEESKCTNFNVTYGTNPDYKPSSPCYCQSLRGTHKLETPGSRLRIVVPCPSWLSVNTLRIWITQGSGLYDSKPAFENDNLQFAVQYIYRVSHQWYI